MLKAIAFDMDETLLSINLNAFVALLLHDDGSILASIGRRNPVGVYTAFAGAMLELNRGGRDGSRTNREVFDAAIERRCGIPLADPVIADAIECYEREVLPHRNGRTIDARPMPGGIEAIEGALDRGLKVALFTNPSFSRACIGCRMGWAGIADAPFEHVTVMENSRHCKPDAAYYREALAAVGLAPEEVLMVGNDPKRDFPEPDCGLATAYVGRGRPGRALWAGSMAEFSDDLDRVIELFEERGGSARA